MVEILTQNGAESLELHEFEERVRCGLVEPETPVCFPLVTEGRWVQARELEIFRGLYSPMRIHFLRYFHLSAFPAVTFGIICIAVALYVVMALQDPALSLETLVAWGAKSNTHIFEFGESWRLLTANLLHGGFLHIFLNIFVLFHVGGALEQAYRTRDYLLIVVASGLGATLASLLLTENISVGISGVVFGALGGLVVFGHKYGKLIPGRYKRYFGWAVVPYVAFLLYWGAVVEQADNWGHLGGLLAGALCAWSLPARVLADGRQPFDRFRVALVGTALAATVLAGPVLKPWLPLLQPQPLGEMGLLVGLPKGWTPLNHMERGGVVFGNALGAVFGVATREHDEAPELELVAAELVAEMGDPDLELELSEAPPVAGQPAMRIFGRARYPEHDYTEELEMRLLRKGKVEYRMWLRTCCGRHSDYRRVADRIFESVRWLPHALPSGGELGEDGDVNLALNALGPLPQFGAPHGGRARAPRRR